MFISNIIQHRIWRLLLNFWFHADKPVFLSYMEGDPVNLYVFHSDSVNLTCQNSAEPAANMSWSFDGKPFTNLADHYIVRINEYYNIIVHIKYIYENWASLYILNVFSICFYKIFLNFMRNILVFQLYYFDQINICKRSEKKSKKKDRVFCIQDLL